MEEILSRNNADYHVAIVGAGLVGNKRAAALHSANGCELCWVADIDRQKAETLAKQYGSQATTDWQCIIADGDVNIVVVSTVNKALAHIAIAALKMGKHVLCEKPLGRNPQESQMILKSAEKNSVVLKTGFNHRHHPAITKAKEIAQQEQIGQILYLRCRYGHGGRPRYEKEWRADKDLCGGGELLDQGVHVADLFRWFAGDFEEAFGYTPTYFWNMEVEDNAFALFSSHNGVVASMHTSWTQWKNIFSFEIFGSEGYLIIEGLGGNYGTETLRIGRRKPEGGPPDEQILEFPGPDFSWQEEWKEFVAAIEQEREPIGNGWDGYQANRMIEAVYKSAKTGQIVKI